MQVRSEYIPKNLADLEKQQHILSDISGVILSFCTQSVDVFTQVTRKHITSIFIEINSSSNNKYVICSFQLFIFEVIWRKKKGIEKVKYKKPINLDKNRKVLTDSLKYETIIEKRKMCQQGHLFSFSLGCMFHEFPLYSLNFL